jgi:hypothetical protein
MPGRPTGSPTAFWDGATTYNATTNPGGGLAVTANAVSKSSRIPYDVDQVTIYVFANAATTISVEVAHWGTLTSEGDQPDGSTPASSTSFYPFYYGGGTPGALTLALPATVTPTTAGFAAAIEIPDWTAVWLRLRSSGANVNLTAGWEGRAD